MNTISISSGNVKLVAHRGVSGLERENTNAAFLAAGNRSYWGIETDTHKTADGVFVVIHDSTTGRVAERNLDVNKSTYAELCEILLKDMDGTSTRQDLRIPTLKDYSTICHRYGKVSVLELKDDFSSEDLENMIALIREIGQLENTIFISFNLNNLIRLRAILPQQKAQYLTTKFDDEILQSLLQHHLDLDIHYKALTAEAVQTLKAHNIVINTWTCDDPADAQKLIDLGVDQITSNILE